MGCISIHQERRFRRPIVAGIYGLVIAAEPTLAPAQFDSALFSTATDLGTAGKDDKAGWGRVSADAAVAKAKQMSATDTFAPEVFISSPGASSKLTGTIQITVAATDDTAVVRTDIYVNNKLFASETLAPFSFALDTTKFPAGATTLQAKAADGASNVGTSTSITVNVANDMVAPVAAIQSPLDGSKVGGGCGQRVGHRRQTREAGKPVDRWEGGRDCLRLFDERVGVLQLVNWLDHYHDEGQDEGHDQHDHRTYRGGHCQGWRGK